MKAQGYRVFEIVAWPAVVWCPVEAVLRGIQGDARGAAWATLLAGMAAGMIAGGRMARGQKMRPVSQGRPEPS